MLLPGGLNMKESYRKKTTHKQRRKGWVVGGKDRELPKKTHKQRRKGWVVGGGGGGETESFQIGRRQAGRFYITG